MERIDLASYSKQIKESYDKVVRNDPEVSWVVYSTDKNATLTPTATGLDDLNEFVEEFVDGKVQYGLSRVNVPGTEVSKLLLVGWCPDNAPLRSRTSFASNFADVAKVLHGYHVQVTARDQDDLDIDDFLQRVGAASGARYAIQSVKKTSYQAPVVKPIIAKSKPAVPTSANKPSVIPTSTGKPIGAIATAPIYKPVHDDGSQNNEDEWGGEKEIEERDFSKKPLETVPSAYKPLKVDMASLRAGKSDTVSSTPKPKPVPAPAPAKKEPEEEPKPVTARISVFGGDSGRLAELPKPKVSHSVASRFQPVETPSFGSKPPIPVGIKKNDDKTAGGLSRDFGAQGGKTPAQLWAEKHGKFETVSTPPEIVKSGSSEPTPEVSSLSSRFAQSSIQDEEEEIQEPVEEPEEEEEEEEETPSPPSHPETVVRSVPPPPPTRPEPEPEVEEEEDEDEQEVPPPAPVRPIVAEAVPPPAPVRPEPTVSKGETAIAEYEYEKDEDNEIGFAEGETITNVQFADQDWWSGTNAAGETGLFPAAYVKLNDKNTAVAAPTPAPVAAPVAVEAPKSQGETAVAEYEYEKDEDNEISFAEGELITEVEFLDDDWWKGKNKAGEVGLFPSNYVKLN